MSTNCQMNSSWYFFFFFSHILTGLASAVSSNFTVGASRWDLKGTKCKFPCGHVKFHWSLNRSGVKDLGFGSLFHPLVCSRDVLMVFLVDKIKQWRVGERILFHSRLVKIDLWTSWADFIRRSLSFYESDLLWQTRLYLEFHFRSLWAFQITIRTMF